MHLKLCCLAWICQLLLFQPHLVGVGTICSTVFCSVNFGRLIYLTQKDMNAITRNPVERRIFLYGDFWMSSFSGDLSRFEYLWTFDLPNFRCFLSFLPYIFLKFLLDLLKLLKIVLLILPRRKEKECWTVRCHF